MLGHYCIIAESRGIGKAVAAVFRTFIGVDKDLIQLLFFG